jgi:hypothetical protein
MIVEEEAQSSSKFSVFSQAAGGPRRSECQAASSRQGNALNGEDRPSNRS